MLTCTLLLPSSSSTIFFFNGEREAATALFEAAIALNDSDAVAHNNLGFCLLPDRPKDALVALERAAELSFPQRLIFECRQSPLRFGSSPTLLKRIGPCCQLLR